MSDGGAAAVGSAGGQTVVFAVTPTERSQFFPGELDAGASALGAWLAEAEMAETLWVETLERLRPTVLVTGWRTPALPPTWLAHAMCPLRYVCHITGSVRHLVPREFIARGGVVTNWAGLPAPQVAEHALLLALAALRNAGQWRACMAEPGVGLAKPRLGTRTLFGRRVGLHGFGAVARGLLPLLRPFNVAVTVHASVPDALLAQAGVTRADTLGGLFAGADVVFECEALTPETAGCVHAGVLARLPDNAVFVNVARGGLVDEAALVAEAARGRIRVAVDVMQQEPANLASPLVRTEGVIVSPHIAGPTMDRYPECGLNALGNLQRYLRGQSLDGRVTLEMYDRAT